jgi:hypothetical protein
MLIKEYPLRTHVTVAENFGKSLISSGVNIYFTKLPLLSTKFSELINLCEEKRFLV